VISRRPFITAFVVGFVIALASLATTASAQEYKAQQTGKIYRVGMLSPAGRPSPSNPTITNLAPRALHELGYVEGQNLVVERRFAEGKIDRLSGLARELVGLRVDVIVAVSAAAVQAAKEATKTVPVVMAFSSDPVGRGFARASLDRAETSREWPWHRKLSWLASGWS
jgi:putative ABC transport system substrate-binding protein